MAADAGAPRLDWARDGGGWPNRDASRFVDAGGLRWHVQVLDPPEPRATTLLLLHGTGSATHSWRALAPRLAQSFRVVAPDLPGHGFTAMPPPEGLSLPGMAAAVAALLDALELAPALVAGHSAGAAVGARMALDGRCAPRGLVGLAPALLPLSGLAGQLFSPAARWLGGVPLAPRLLARFGESPAVLERLLRGTGSSIGDDGRRGYAKLVANPGHVAGAIGMMARWDLRALERDLPRLPVPLRVIVGARDTTLPPGEGERVRRCVPGAAVETLAGLGHLAHEERPDLVATRIAAFAMHVGALAARPGEAAVDPGPNARRGADPPAPVRRS